MGVRRFRFNKRCRNATASEIKVAPIDVRDNDPNNAPAANKIIATRNKERWPNRNHKIAPIKIVNPENWPSVLGCASPFAKRCFLSG